MLPENVVETDVLVIGGGIAGCIAAIKAREQGVNVTLVNKGYVGKSGATPWANMFAVFNPEWGHDLDAWVNQITRMGEYVNNREWVEIAFKDSYARWQELLSWGLECYKYDDGEIRSGITYRAAREGPPDLKAKFPVEAKQCYRRRNAELYRAQTLKVGAKIMDRIMITDLLMQDGRVVGALGFHTISGESYTLRAKATVMATGPSDLSAYNHAAIGTTGDGEAMAYRVGGELTGHEHNMCHGVPAEFPADRWNPRIDRSKRFTKGETRGHPKRINVEGDNLAVLYPGARCAEAWEAHAGRAPIFWDLSDVNQSMTKLISGLKADIPEGYPRLEIDIEAERLGRMRCMVDGEFGMGPHVADGIIPTNTKCATTVPGLYAAGDALGARFSGARYNPGGFSMACCSTSGARAGLGAAEYALQAEKPIVDEEQLAGLKKIMYAPTERKGGFSPLWVTQVMHNTMKPYWILYVKHADRLQSALTQIEFMRDHLIPLLTAKDAHELRLAHETKSLLLIAEMKLRASLFRTESRAGHYREDYPRRDDPNWLAWVRIKEEQGKMKLLKEPIPEKWWPDLSKPYEERYSYGFPGE